MSKSYGKLISGSAVYPMLSQTTSTGIWNARDEFQARYTGNWTSGIYPIDFLMVAGGGGGGGASYGNVNGEARIGSGGAGGAGEFINSSSYRINCSSLIIKIGAGAGYASQSTGQNSSLTNVSYYSIENLTYYQSNQFVVAGGGRASAGATAGGPGGSGGGGSAGGYGATRVDVPGGASIATIGLGNAGGASAGLSSYPDQTGAGGGGGGAGAPGSYINGGNGASSTIISTSLATSAGVGEVSSGNVYFAGGGASSNSITAGTLTFVKGTPGLGGGGLVQGFAPNAAPAVSRLGAGSPNTGGGGGGSGGQYNYNNAGGTYESPGPGGGGGSGVVILRYPTTLPPAKSIIGSPVYSVENGYNVYIWKTSGSITFY